MRLDMQLTPDSLLPLERFSLGGVDTIRGYLDGQLVSDNGIFGSAEFRISLTSDPRIFQLIPFIDFGTGWNNQTLNPDPATLVSIGIGCRWLIMPDLSLRLDYGIPLISAGQRGDSLQGQGFSFSLRYQPF